MRRTNNNWNHDIVKLDAWPLVCGSWQSLALLSGFRFLGFPSKCTGRHWFSSTSQARIRCLFSGTTLLIPQVPGSLLTVTKRKGCSLMHRFSWYILPPVLVHTAFTLSSSDGWRKDCVGLLQPPWSLMYFSHSLLSREVGNPGRMCRLTKLL